MSSRADAGSPLARVASAVVACDRCPRLREYCARVAREKKAAHRGDAYWGKPVPGFGDPGARILVLGLAPAAHGANRTGRIFTGDGSGDFLMRAMHAHGLASLPTSRQASDGLRLTDAYISAAARCAPPGNRPTPNELENCLPHLVAELAALGRVRVVVALGRIASDTYWKLARAKGVPASARQPFAHGHVFEPAAAGVPALVDSYHPSRQNTNTGRLTAAMLDDVFRSAARLARR